MSNEPYGQPAPDPMKPGARFSAVLNPKRTDDLKRSAVPLIGERYEWEAMWIAADDEPYAGELICGILNPPDSVKNAALTSMWMLAPLCDLDDVRTATMEEAE